MSNNQTTIEYNNGKVLENWLTKYKGRALEKEEEIIHSSIQTASYNTNKFVIVVVYFIIPLLAGLLIKLFTSSDFIGWLCSLSGMLGIYLLMAYNFPIALDSVWQKWHINETTIYFSKLAEQRRFILPWKILFKKNESQLDIQAIESVEVSTYNLNSRMDHRFSSGIWALKVHPLLQTEYILKIKLTNGKNIELRNKDVNLILYTLSILLKNNKLVYVK